MHSKVSVYLQKSWVGGMKGGLRDIEPESESEEEEEEEKEITHTTTPRRCVTSHFSKHTCTCTYVEGV